MSDYLQFESPDDELRDNELPDNELSDEELRDEDYPDHEDSDTATCPHCGAEVYEDAVQCPVCGNYITFSSGPLTGWPTGLLLLGLAGLVAAILALAGLLGR
ncbi:MAG: zinc ribbon domain-containing protein [Patescibacteria group bacterium]|nr:zinc ribbon domain-containing protein [Patescibacteria group bacterium]